MICALIIALTINVAEIQEAGVRIDILIKNAIMKPQEDYRKEIEFIRYILSYNEKKNIIEDLNSARLESVISLYSQTLYDIEEFIKTNNDKYIKAALIDKIVGDTILNEIDMDLKKNKKGS